MQFHWLTTFYTNTSFFVREQYFPSTLAIYCSWINHISDRLYITNRHNHSQYTIKNANVYLRMGAKLCIHPQISVFILHVSYTISINQT